MKRFIWILMSAVVGLFLVGALAVASPLYQGTKPTSETTDLAKMSSEIGSSGITVDIDVPISITDPITLKELLRFDLTIQSVDLTYFGDKTKDTNSFLAQATTAATQSLVNLPVILSKPRIEKLEILTNSIPVQVNVEVSLNSNTTSDVLEQAILGEIVPNGTSLASTRARLQIEGLDYTTLDLATTSIEILLNDIRTNIITEFSK